MWFDVLPVDTKLLLSGFAQLLREFLHMLREPGSESVCEGCVRGCVNRVLIGC